MELTTFWFILIAVLWAGYFVLEGFDFGVGMLLPAIGRDEAERRAILTTLGPVWDGNEVWLIVAGGATFAAFPQWYATMFSGFYLPLLLILVALIFRGVAFEFRSKRSSPRWRKNWDAAIVGGSFVPALLWGVAFANIVRGVPLAEQDGAIEYAGGFFNLLNPYALVGGITVLSLFLAHGCVFLSLKTDGSIRDRAKSMAIPIGLVAAVLAVIFLVWTQLAYSDKPLAWILVAVAAVSWLLSIFLHTKAREGWAFLFSAITIAGAVAYLFTVLYPNVFPASNDPALSLNITNASSTPYTLQVMTIVAVIFTPLVILYQGWTYWVFRKRVSPSQITNPHQGSLDFASEAELAQELAKSQKGT